MNIFARCDLPTINGQRVTLRPIEDSDTDNIVRWRNRREVMRFFIFREPFTRELHEGWLRTRVETGEVIQYIIIDRISDEAVGSVYLRDISYDEQSAEYGIFIGEDSAKGRGLGTETAALFTDFALELLKLKKIKLRVIDGNDIARRSYERAGFRLDGTPSEEVMLDGEMKEIIFMSMLAADREGANG